jgi:hypothetical protein
MESKLAGEILVHIPLAAGARGAGELISFQVVKLRLAAMRASLVQVQVQVQWALQAAQDILQAAGAYQLHLQAVRQVEQAHFLDTQAGQPLAVSAGVELELLEMALRQQLRLVEMVELAAAAAGAHGQQ